MNFIRPIDHRAIDIKRKRRKNVANKEDIDIGKALVPVQITS